MCVSCPEISPINWERATGAGSVGWGRIEVVSLSEHLIQPPPPTKWSSSLSPGSHQRRVGATNLDGWKLRIRGTHDNASICHQSHVASRNAPPGTGYADTQFGGCVLFCCRIIMASGVGDVISALTLSFLHHALFLHLSCCKRNN